MNAINFYDIDMENYNQNNAAAISPINVSEQAIREQKLLQNGWIVFGVLVLVFGIFMYEIIHEDLNRSWKEVVESE